MSRMSTMNASERADLKDRIGRVLSEILTDKYGDEYGVKITLRFVPRDQTTTGNGAA